MFSLQRLIIRYCIFLWSFQAGIVVIHGKARFLRSQLEDRNTKQGRFHHFTDARKISRNLSAVDYIFRAEYLREKRLLATLRANNTAGVLRDRVGFRGVSGPSSLSTYPERLRGFSRRDHVSAASSGARNVVKRERIDPEWAGLIDSMGNRRQLLRRNQEYWWKSGFIEGFNRKFGAPSGQTPLLPVNRPRLNDRRLYNRRAYGNQAATDRYLAPQRTGVSYGYNGMRGRTEPVNSAVRGSVGTGTRTDARAFEGSNLGSNEGQFGFSQTSLIRDKVSKENAKIENSKPECHEPVDLAFLVDGSGSIDPRRNFPKVRKFLKQLAAAFEVGPQKTKIALVQFSGRFLQRIEFGFDQHNDLKGVIDAIDRMTQFKRTTFIGEGFKVISRDVFNGVGGDRPEVRNVLVVLTDGGTYDFDVARDVSMKLKDNGTTIICIGVGEPHTLQSFLPQIEEYASDPSEQYVFTRGFEELDRVVKAVSSITCDEAKNSPANTSVANATSNGDMNSYRTANHYWAFDVATNNIVSDLIGHKHCTLSGGAHLFTSVKRQMVASTVEFGGYLNFGNWVGDCITDPDLCANGLTMTMWLRIQVKNINQNSEYQYLFSSGAEGESTRGIVFLLKNKDEIYRLLVRTTGQAWSISLASDTIPMVWFSFTFSWKRSLGLVACVNGVKVDEDLKPTNAQGPDVSNTLLVAKPATSTNVDYQTKFRIDDLAIFYRFMTPEDIQTILFGGTPPSQNGGPDLCVPNPCTHGNCSTDSDTPSGFICQCSLGWTGDRCNQSTSQTPSGSGQGGSPSSPPPGGNPDSGNNSGGGAPPDGMAGKPGSPSNVSHPSGPPKPGMSPPNSPDSPGQDPGRPTVQSPTTDSSQSPGHQRPTQNPNGGPPSAPPGTNPSNGNQSGGADPPGGNVPSPSPGNPMSAPPRPGMSPPRPPGPLGPVPGRPKPGGGPSNGRPGPPCTGTSVTFGNCQVTLTFPGNLNLSALFKPSVPPSSSKSPTTSKSTGNSQVAKSTSVQPASTSTQAVADSPQTYHLPPIFGPYDTGMGTYSYSSCTPSCMSDCTSGGCSDACCGSCPPVCRRVCRADCPSRCCGRDSVIPQKRQTILQ